MTFKSAYLKLTLFYVLIVMIISLVFSFVIYNISSSELNRGLGRQTRVLRELPTENRPPFPIQDLEKIRLEQLDASNNHLRLNLIYFNLLILALSSIASYFFAKRTLRPIEEMVNAQNRFIADASHELKTPLTAMRAEIEVNLRDRKLKLSETKKLLKSNLEEINKLESLSSALLKLAKYQEDLKLDFEKLSLPEIVTKAYEKVENIASEKSIEFDNNFEEVYIKGDKQSLVELFVILLDNAVKYSPKKSKVSIKISKDHKFAQIKIIDHGVGIKASDLPYIFNRFYRADNSRSKEEIDGYGLGLSIAKRITELHGGNIIVKSKIRDGSTFIVKLPARI
ncbi:MAG: HAMP domain-containing sensor histidine kinase [Candidatus Berkelbacteria bacterium]|nr:HAMP domain-containing sensor histidine kinase [Candidatus Berkelbacteria bacterium]